MRFFNSDGLTFCLLLISVATLLGCSGGDERQVGETAEMTFSEYAAARDAEEARLQELAAEKQ